MFCDVGRDGSDISGMCASCVRFRAVSPELGYARGGDYPFVIGLPPGIPWPIAFLSSSFDFLCSSPLKIIGHTRGIMTGTVMMDFFDTRAIWIWRWRRRDSWVSYSRITSFTHLSNTRGSYSSYLTVRSRHCCLLCAGLIRCSPSAAQPPCEPC